MRKSIAEVAKLYGEEYKRFCEFFDLTGETNGQGYWMTDDDQEYEEEDE